MFQRLRVMNMQDQTWAPEGAGLGQSLEGAFLVVSLVLSVLLAHDSLVTQHSFTSVPGLCWALGTDGGIGPTYYLKLSGDLSLAGGLRI